MNKPRRTSTSTMQPGVSVRIFLRAVAHVLDGRSLWLRDAAGRHPYTSERGRADDERVAAANDAARLAAAVRALANKSKAGHPPIDAALVGLIVSRATGDMQVDGQLRDMLADEVPRIIVNLQELGVVPGKLDDAE